MGNCRIIDSSILVYVHTRLQATTLRIKKRIKNILTVGRDTIYRYTSRDLHSTFMYIMCIFRALCTYYTNGMANFYRKSTEVINLATRHGPPRR